MRESNNPRPHFYTLPFAKNPTLICSRCGKTCKRTAMNQKQCRTCKLGKTPAPTQG